MLENMLNPNTHEIVKIAICILLGALSGVPLARVICYKP